MSALEYKNAGNKAFTDGRFDEAVTAFSKAIELEDNYVFFSNRSGAYASMKRFQDALNDADACVKRAPQWAKGYSRRGGALFGLGRLEDAKAAYEEGLKLEPSNQACKDGIAEVNAKAAAASRPRPAGPGGAGVGLGSLFGPDMFTKLRANPKTAKYMQEPDFVQMMTLLQSNPQAMGSLMQQDKRLQVALGVLIGVDFSSMPRAPGQADDDDVFGRGGDDDDEEEPVSANRAHPSMARAGPAAPAGAAAGAASSSSSSSSSSSKMSDDAAGAAAAPQAEEEGQEVDEELEAEKRERAATRAKADAEKDLGTVAYKKRDFATAASHYLKAAEIDPSNPIYLANLSIVRNEEGDFKSCVDACKDALAAGKMEPVTKARLLVRMGNALGKLNRWGEAIEAFKHAILEDNAPATRTLLKAAEVSKKKADEEAYLDPVKSEAAKEEGNELFREGKFADAIDKYTEALKRDPSNYKVYSNRAACYTKLMQWDKGLDDCAKCLAADPKFVKAYIRRGKIQHFLKQYPQALATFKAGLELEPGNEDLLDGMRVTREAIATSNRTGEMDQQRIAESMKDPEVMAIMRDPVMNQVLQDLKDNPAAAQRALKDPSIMANLDKLVAAGIIRFN